MIIALTGHRPDKLALRFGWAAQVKRVLTDYIESREVRPTCIISGMALGFDTLGAQVALDLGIPLMAAIPFEGQEAKWPERDRFEYYRLIDGATSMRVIYPGGFHAAKLLGRNKWMVDHAERACVRCGMDRPAVRATACGTPIRWVAPWIIFGLTLKEPNNGNTV